MAKSEHDAPIDLGGLVFSGFINEKHMCDYLEDNVQLFVNDVLDAEYQSHIREYAPMTGRQIFANKQSCADFLITSTNGTRYLIEVKNPKSVHSEMIRSVSQLLAYGAMADSHKPIDRLVLVTSNTCGAVQAMIEKYELPVMVVIMNKDVLATWDKDWARQWQDRP